MSINKWVYEKATGKWLRGSGTPDPRVYLTNQQDYGLADLGDAMPYPDPIYERWDATLGRRPATPTEVLESQQAQRHAEGLTKATEDKTLVTLLLMGLRVQLGRVPTVAEIAAERMRFASIYMSLF